LSMAESSARAASALLRLVSVAMAAMRSVLFKTDGLSCLDQTVEKTVARMHTGLECNRARGKRWSADAFQK